ncbi:hypothetical protein ACHWQZ_G009328 [Mnemiopsis leidyi]
MPPRRNLITILVDDLLTLSPNDTPGYLQLQAFADDIVSLAEGNDLDVIWDRTCKTINTITKWCKTKVLTISALETKIVMFTWNKKWTLRPIVVDNTTIKLSTSAKFLGSPSQPPPQLLPQPLPQPTSQPHSLPFSQPLSQPSPQPNSHSPVLSQSHIPNVVITSNIHHQPVPQPVCAKSPVQCRTPELSKNSPEEKKQSPTFQNSDSLIKDCTINITSKTSDSIKQERMEYSEFVNKDSSTLLQDSKIIHTEIKDIMCVLKQGSARFVNCTFNFNFPN